MSKFAKKNLEFNSIKCPEKILYSERACSIYKFLEELNMSMIKTRFCILDEKTTIKIFLNL